VFSAILAAVERVFWARGWSVMFGDSGDEIVKQNAFIARSIESNVAGLIISPAVGTTPRHLEAFGQRLPIVVAGREIRGGAFDRVCIEYEKGLTSAVSHLVSLGHRAIGWMGGGSNTATARRGIRIYREVLLKHGLIPTNLWQYTCLPSRHEGYAGMRQLLKVAPELTAVVCFSDLLAIGAMRALHQQGMIPGRDMSVIGFDDLEEACCAIPTRCGGRLFADAGTAALVASGLWKSRNAASVYERLDLSAESRKSDLFPTPTRAKGGQ
jgi:LacI family transcriptional regulator